MLILGLISHATSRNINIIITSSRTTAPICRTRSSILSSSLLKQIHARQQKTMMTLQTNLWRYNAMPLAIAVLHATIFSVSETLAFSSHSQYFRVPTERSTHTNYQLRRRHFNAASSSVISKQLKSLTTGVNVDESAMEERKEKSKTSSKSSVEERYVMVRRNKQSMAFRNGSPLVFSGSVESTFQVQYNTEKDSNLSSKSIPIGAFVGVMVNANADVSKGARNHSKGANYGRGRKRGKNNSSNEPSSCHRYILCDGLTSVQKYTPDGNHVDDNTNDEDFMIMKKLLKESNLIGYGVYNPKSMYRVRMLCHQTSHSSLFGKVKDIMTGTNKSVRVDDDDDDDIGTASRAAIEIIVKTKLQDAHQARVALNLPSAETDSYRLCNGEGDGLSGLAIDILGGRVAVIMSSAAWCEIYKDSIVKVVDEVLQRSRDTEASIPLEIVWRNTPSRLAQDGYDIDSSSDVKGDSTSEDILDKKSIIVTENGIKYSTFPYDTTSQKTGFYCDQRENREWLSKYCKDKRVLDLCCYNGGFALNAMIKGGARSCTGIDSSPVAIDAAIQNAQLNDLSPLPVESSSVQDNHDGILFLQKDITQFMKEAYVNKNEYDMIVLDPPKLAPSISGLERASRKYHALNRDAIKLINAKEGGMLLTCTCSGAMTQKEGGQFFLETIKGAALAAGRQVTLLRSCGAASCHTQCPASFPAGAYLTASLFYVSPASS